MIQATNINIFGYPLALIKINPFKIDQFEDGAVNLVYQCFYPEEMLLHFTTLDDFESNKGCYYVFDVLHMELMGCLNNKALKMLKDKLKKK